MNTATFPVRMSSFPAGLDKIFIDTNRNREEIGRFRKDRNRYCTPARGLDFSSSAFVQGINHQLSFGPYDINDINHDMCLPEQTQWKSSAAVFATTNTYGEIAIMYVQVEMSGNVVIPPSELDKEGLMLQRSIILRLLEDIANRKATKDHGYFLAVTTLKNIGEGKVRELAGDVLFPVVFSCITFKPFKGEILQGVVDRILKHGIFLKCGPIEHIFLSAQTMKDYRYVAGDEPMFLNEKHSKLEKNGVVRFRVLGLKWMESDREFQVLATLAGDFLGPIL